MFLQRQGYPPCYLMSTPSAPSPPLTYFLIVPSPFVFLGLRRPTMPHVSMEYPPGFRFHPTDEELISFYLSPKVTDPSYTTAMIGDADFKKCEPWDLPSTAKTGEKQLYFFCHKDRKYQTGNRFNRATQEGYWIVTGKDKEIYRCNRVLIGMKKTLVFYNGRSPKGVKTNWVMYEFRIEDNIPKISEGEWVVCRIFHKNITEKKDLMDGRESSFEHEYLPDLSMPMDASNNHPGYMGHRYNGKMEPNNLFSNTSQ